MKGLIFDLLAGLFWFLLDLMQQLLDTENIYLLDFFGCIVAFSFYSVWKINRCSTMLKIYLLTFIMQQLNWIEKKKLASFHWSFEINLVPWKEWLEKTSLTTLLALSYRINSILLLFECINIFNIINIPSRNKANYNF